MNTATNVVLNGDRMSEVLESLHKNNFWESFMLTQVSCNYAIIVIISIWLLKLQV